MKFQARKTRVGVEMILFRVAKTFFIVMGLSLAFAILVLLGEKGLQSFVDWAW
jgi:hypothetical protein